MKQLFICRHAKSSWKHPELTDFDRPLNSRGKEDAPRMGNILADKGITPNLILTSPANRAKTTALTMADALNFPLEAIQENAGIYLADTGTLIKILGNLPADINSFMIFGHNPGFTDLANLLGDFYIDNMPTCSIVALQFDMDDWSKLKSVKGELMFFEYPKLH
jgi:phosphohistidine phosphatase